jgi:hypothetical protein
MRCFQAWIYKLKACRRSVAASRRCTSGARGQRRPRPPPLRPESRTRTHRQVRHVARARDACARTSSPLTAASCPAENLPGFCRRSHGPFGWLDCRCRRRSRVGRRRCGSWGRVRCGVRWIGCWRAASLMWPAPRRLAIECRLPSSSPDDPTRPARRRASPNRPTDSWWLPCHPASRARRGHAVVPASRRQNFRVQPTPATGHGTPGVGRRESPPRSSFE